jgi:hypothetical protein
LLPAFADPRPAVSVTLGGRRRRCRTRSSGTLSPARPVGTEPPDRPPADADETPADADETPADAASRAGGGQPTLMAETSSSILTFSPSMTPPVSSTALKVRHR